MPALPPEALWRKLDAVLPAGTGVRTSPLEVRPSIIDAPDVGVVRVYLWTLTEDRSREGRPPGEFKIQLILPGQALGERGSLDLSEMPTVLLGYSPDFGVFVGWEARLYTDFGYSANVQVRDDLLIEAREDGWAVGPPRRSQGQQEVRVAFSPAHLCRYLAASAEADGAQYEGVAREAFFLSRVPGVTTSEAPSEANAASEYVSATRRKVAVERALRSPLFARCVKLEYDYACAVCLTQMGIVEAAHIVPVSEGGSDEVWNGIAFCPNHHRLFDSRLFVVDPELVVRVDQPRVVFLAACGRNSGVEILERHDGQRLLKPIFWEEDTGFRDRMCGGLQSVLAKAGIS